MEYKDMTVRQSKNGNVIVITKSGNEYVISNSGYLNDNQLKELVDKTISRIK